MLLFPGDHLGASDVHQIMAFLNPAVFASDSEEASIEMTISVTIDTRF